MASGFELYKVNFPENKTFLFCSGQTCSAGDALVISATNGWVTKAAAGSTCNVVGVAAQDVASSATTPNVLVWDPRNIYKVNRKSGDTASNTTMMLVKCHFESARTIDTSASTGTTAPIRVLSCLDTVASGECEVTFVKHLYSGIVK